MEKIKLSKIKPNPFKEKINGGILNEENIKKIQSNLSKLGFMGSLPIFLKDNQYYLIAGHHRLEALKREFGPDYKVKIDIKDYSEEQILRGMIIENLSQRGLSYEEEKENLVMLREYLRKNKRLQKAKEIEGLLNWIDEGKEEIITKGKLKRILGIYDNLSDELKPLVSKNGELSILIAYELSMIKDKEEQKNIFESLKKLNISGRPHYLLRKYRKASKDVRDKINKGESRLQDVNVEILKEELEEIKNKPRPALIKIMKPSAIRREAQNTLARTNENILKTCIFLNGLSNNASLVQKEIKKSLELNKKYTLFLKRLLNEI